MPNLSCQKEFMQNCENIHFILWVIDFLFIQIIFMKIIYNFESKFQINFQIWNILFYQIFIQNYYQIIKIAIIIEQNHHELSLKYNEADIIFLVTPMVTSMVTSIVLIMNLVCFWLILSVNFPVVSIMNRLKTIKWLLVGVNLLYFIQTK